jgi:hypothetical protein
MFINKGYARSGMRNLCIGAPGDRKDQQKEFSQATSWR